MFVTLKDIVLILLITLFFSCDKHLVIPVANSHYFINIYVDDFEGKSIFLYKLTPKLLKVDSSLVKNNSAYFDGKIDFTERYIITLKDMKGAKLFIVENDSIEIIIDKTDLRKSTLKGSLINDELISFQNKSNRITSKIESLFPDLQRARLNNDAEALKKISSQIAEIEQENIAFNFEYVNLHPDSFLSAMILNDLSKREEIDTEKISKSYHLLSKKVKQSVDSKSVERFLLLQL